MTSEEVREVVAAYFAALRAGDIEAWVATFAEDGSSHDPVGSEVLAGRAALGAFAKNMWGMWDRLSLQEREVFVCSNEAAVKWTGYGRTKKGREVRFEGIDILAINPEGKIQSMRGYWDAAAVMSQLAAS
jgi:steroid delta-isomerase